MQWFRTVDRDGSGQIGATELQQALGMGNLHFSLQVIASMIRCAHAIRCKERFRRSYAKFFLSSAQLALILAACRMYDKDRSGSISFTEFQGLVRKSPVTCVPPHDIVLHNTVCYVICVAASAVLRLDWLPLANRCQCCCSINFSWKCTLHSSILIQTVLDP